MWFTHQWWWLCETEVGLCGSHTIGGGFVKQVGPCGSHTIGGGFVKQVGPCGSHTIGGGFVKQRLDLVVHTPLVMAL